MPAYNVNVDEGVTPTLDRFAPSLGTGLEAAVGSTFNENISTLGYDYAKVLQANSGEKLDKPTAEAAVKQAGVKLEIPDAGYTQEALDILIKRQQDQAARQSTMDRTPWSWIGSPVRGAAQLLAGVVDPLNVASAFIPFVGEARVASMLAGAGEGVAARLGARAAIGAVEGAGGQAVLEPAVYGLHSQLGDDYHMSDSLVNIAFGGLLGGGLHAVGGSVAEALRVGADPYARFAGLDAKQVSKVLEYEKAMRAGEPAVSVDWTPAMKRAAGFDDMVPATAVEAAVERPPEAPSAVSMAPEAPFAKLYETTPDSARTEALGTLHDELRTELLTDIEAGDKSAAGDLAALDKGQVPTRFEDRVQAEANNVMATADMARAVTGVAEPPARFVVGMASAETRETALRSALADMAQGRLPSVDALVRLDPKTIGPHATATDVMSVVERQRRPESVALGSAEASGAGDRSLKDAPADNLTEAAQAELSAATKRLSDLQKNLELGGADPEKLAAFTSGLARFDEAIKDAGKIGDAIMQHVLCGLRQ